MLGYSQHLFIPKCYSFYWLLIANFGTQEIKAYLTHQLLYQIFLSILKSSIKAYMNVKKSV